MRVVFLGKYYPPASGGIENHTRELAQGLAARGVEVRVVVVNHAASTGRDVTFESLARTPTVREQDGPVQVVRVGRWANVAKLDLCPELLGVLRRELRDPPDLWHLQAPNVTMMAAIAVLRGIRPLVITHHSDIVRQRVLKYAIRPLEEIVYRRATRLLSDSPTYGDGSKLLQRYAEKTEVLPLGIDLASFARPSPASRAITEQLRARYTAPIWLSVGRLIYYKGLDVGLEALRSVPGVWLIAGTGPLADSLKSRAAALGVADRVVWLGSASSEEVVGAYHAATAFWFPSIARSEGFGIVQVEAMAAGCPVINTAIPGSGVPWVSPHEVSGLTVPPNDPTAFAGAANRIASDAGLRQRLSEGGRARAAAEFDCRVMADRCLDIYRRLISSRSPREQP